MTNNNYGDLTLSELRESPTNPRKRYNVSSLKELAESLRPQGGLRRWWSAVPPTTTISLLDRVDFPPRRSPI